MPNIYRLELEDNESSIRSSFKRRGTLLVSERLPSTDWEWYFLMQHYGAPTRLLDWSDGALIALYFALCPSKVGVADVNAEPAVWMLDPYWLNERAVGVHGLMTVDRKQASGYLPRTFGKSPRRKFPIAINPPHVARRVGVQRSRFTIHGSDKEGLLKLGRRRDSRLVRITIEQSAVMRMRLDLTTCGIWDTTIFPDLEGLSREIIRDWTDTWDPDAKVEV
jgi:hypothetical protein